MQDSKTIEHKGVVLASEKGHIKVNILSQSACASCHAKGACNVSDVQDKTIDVYNGINDYQIGESVNVVMEQKAGFKALFLGYVLPFIIVLCSMIITSSLTEYEAIIGLVSLGILIPYYVVLYSYKEKFKKSFSFKIEKLV